MKSSHANSTPEGSQSFTGGLAGHLHYFMALRDLSSSSIHPSRLHKSNVYVNLLTTAPVPPHLTDSKKANKVLLASRMKSYASFLPPVAMILYSLQLP